MSRRGVAGKPLREPPTSVDWLGHGLPNTLMLETSRAPDAEREECGGNLQSLEGVDFLQEIGKSLQGAKFRRSVSTSSPSPNKNSNDQGCHDSADKNNSQPSCNFGGRRIPHGNG